MKSKLRAARRLTAADWVTLAGAWGWLLLIHLRLALGSLPRQVTAQRQPREASPPSAPRSARDDLPAAATVQRLSRLVGIAARHHLVAMPCLPRALCLQRLLRRRGIEAILRLGVRKPDARTLSAHAWLELDGRPIGEEAVLAGQYAALGGLEDGADRSWQGPAPSPEGRRPAGRIAG